VFYFIKIDLYISYVSMNLSNMENIVLGVITNVRYHYNNYKYALNSWGFMAESFDQNQYVSKPNDDLGDCTITTLNKTMEPNKNYAYVYIENGNIYVRNLFNSNHVKGFHQKNTYFEDSICGKFLLDDPEKLLLTYIQKGIKTHASLNDECYINHFCVEFDYNQNHNTQLLTFCVELNDQIAELSKNVYTRLNKIEDTIKTQNKKTSIWGFK